MDEECDELSEIEQLQKDLSDFPNDVEEEEDEEDNDEEDEEEDEENDEDGDDDDNNIFTSMSLNDGKVEENTSPSNGLDIAVKLEVSILEDEENQNKNKDQPDMVQVKHELSAKIKFLEIGLLMHFSRYLSKLKSSEIYIVFFEAIPLILSRHSVNFSKSNSWRNVIYGVVIQRPTFRNRTKSKRHFLIDYNTITVYSGL